MEQTIDEKVMFVSATDTDAGKTVVTAGLLRKAISQGINAIAIKPIQTGFSFEDITTLESDMHIYAKALPGKFSPDIFKKAMVYTFAKACSPHLAAACEDEQIRIKKIVEHIKGICSEYDLVLVEGIGGLMVPLNDNDLFIDLLEAVNAPVVLVADNKLGAINHCLLSLAQLSRHKVDVTGMVLNNTSFCKEEEKFIRTDNRRTISEYSKVPIVSEIDYVLNHSCDDHDFWKTIDKDLSGIKFVKEKDKWKIV